MITGVVRSGIMGKASTGAKGTTSVKASNSVKLKTIIKPKSKDAQNYAMRSCVPVAQEQAG